MVKELLLKHRKNKTVVCTSDDCDICFYESYTDNLSYCMSALQYDKWSHSDRNMSVHIHVDEVSEVKCVCFVEEWHIIIRLSRDLSIYYVLQIYYEVTAILFCRCRRD